MLVGFWVYSLTQSIPQHYSQVRTYLELTCTRLVHLVSVVLVPCDNEHDHELVKFLDSVCDFLIKGFFSYG